MFLGNLLKDVGGLVNGAVSGVEHFFGGGQPQAPQAPQQAPQAIRAPQAPQQAPAPQGVNLGQLSDMINKSTGFQTFADRQKQQNQFINQNNQPAKPINFNNVVNNAGNQFLKNTPLGNLANTAYNAAVSPTAQGIAKGAGTLAVNTLGSLLPNQSAGEDLSPQQKQALALQRPGTPLNAQQQAAISGIQAGKAASTQDVIQQALLDRAFMGKGAVSKLTQGAYGIQSGAQLLGQAPQVINNLKNQTPQEQASNLTQLIGGAGLLGLGGIQGARGIRDVVTNPKVKQINTNLGEGGYLKVGYPNASDLPQNVKTNIGNYDAGERINNNKLTASDVNKAFDNRQNKPTFTQSDIKSIAESVPSFKANPVMIFNPAYVDVKGTGVGAIPSEPYPALTYTNGTDTFHINAKNYFPKGTDLSKIPKGEQVDMSSALGKGRNKIPVITEQRIGEQLPSSVSPIETPTPPVAPQVGKTDPLESLKQEARKYNSAEEFVKAQANVYHGTKNDFESFSKEKFGSNTNTPSSKKGFFFASNPDTADFYANPGKAQGTVVSQQLENAYNNVIEKAKSKGLANSVENNNGAALIVGNWAKVSDGATSTDVKKSVINKMEALKERFPEQSSKIDEFIKLTKQELEQTNFTKTELFGDVKQAKVDLKNPLVIDDKGNRNGASFDKRIDQAKADGHDGVIIKNTQDPNNTDIYIAFDENQIITSKQLTDLYNQAHAKAPQVGKTLYHGTKGNINDITKLNSVEYGDPEALYGPGVYLTDNKLVAEGYSKTKGVGEGKVLQGVLPKDIKLLNLDKPIPDNVTKIFDKILNPETKINANGKEITIPASETVKGMPAKDIINEIKDMAVSNGYTADEANSLFQNLHVDLAKEGYQGFNHLGGYGKIPHDVTILFDKESGANKINWQPASPISETPTPPVAPQVGKPTARFKQAEPTVAKPTVKFKQATQQEQLASLGLNEVPRPTAESPINNPIENKYIDANTKGIAENQAVKDAIDRRNNAPTIKGLEVPEIKTSGDAVRNGQAKEKMIVNRAEALASAQDKLLGKSPKKMELFVDTVQHPEDLADNAQKLGISRKELKALVDQHNEMTVATRTLSESSARPIDPRQNYIYQDTIKTDATSKTPGNGGIETGTTKERVFRDLREVKSTPGYDIKQQSAGDLTRNWAMGEARAIKMSSILRDLQVHDPTSIIRIDGGFPKGYKPLEIPGMKGYAARIDVYKALGGIKFKDDTPGAMAKTANALDHINTLAKQLELFGGMFHDLKTSIRYEGQELMSSPKRAALSGYNLALAKKFIASPKAYEAYKIKQWDKPGWSDLMAKANHTSFQGQDMAGIGKHFNLEDLNPYMKRVFEQQIDFFKRNTLVSEAKKMGITDPRKATPEQILRLRNTVNQIGNDFGGINLEAIGRNPLIQRILRFITLAPDFTEGKIRTVGNAIAKWGKDNPQGNLARRQLLGEALVVAIASEVGSKLITGNYMNPAQAVLNPNIPLPYKDKGRKLIAKIPGSEITDAYRLGTNPGQFATGHMGAVSSVGAEALSGKDYYGNPLNPDNPNPTLIDNLWASVKSRGPIPVMQAIKQGQGLQNLATTAINIAGGRVNLDPTDPQVVAMNNHFAGVKSGLNTLKNGADIGAFNNYLAREKDPQGKSYWLGPKGSATNAQSLFGNDNVRNAVQTAYKAEADKGNSVDPQWTTLSPYQLKTWERYQSLPPGDRNRDIIVAKSMNVDGSNWISNLETARTAFYATLQAKGNLAPNPNPQDPPTPYPLSTAENTLRGQSFQITDPTQLTQFYADNPQLTEINAKYDQYTNDQRAKLGLTAMNISPPPTPQQAQELKDYAQVPKGGGSKGGNKYQAIYMQAHPDLSTYFAQSAFNSLIKQAGIADQGGTTSQKLLKDIQNVGTYDITKNADGSYSFGTSSSSSSSGSGSGSSSSSSNSFRLKLPSPTRNQPLRAKISSAKRIKFKLNKTNVQRPQAVAGRVQMKLQTPRANNKGATVKSKSNLVKSSS